MVKNVTDTCVYKKMCAYYRGALINPSLWYVKTGYVKYLLKDLICFINGPRLHKTINIYNYAAVSEFFFSFTIFVNSYLQIF